VQAKNSKWAGESNLIAKMTYLNPIESTAKFLSAFVWDLDHVIVTHDGLKTDNSPDTQGRSYMKYM